MARKSKKTGTTKLPWKRLLGKRSGLGAIIAAVALLLLGAINPDLRDSVAEVLSITNPNKPLFSKKQGPLTEGIWTVVNVVDGDTLDIADSTGNKYRVRLIGADTPEVVKPNTPVEPFGPEASDFTKRVIAMVNDRVRIAFDGDQVDKYGRNLAMVYLQLPDGRECWLNELLIREGLARAQTQYRFSKGAKVTFQQAEEEAKKNKRNLWSLSN